MSMGLTHLPSVKFVSDCQCQSVSLTRRDSSKSSLSLSLARLAVFPSTDKSDNNYSSKLTKSEVLQRCRCRSIRPHEKCPRGQRSPRTESPKQPKPRFSVLAKSEAHEGGKQSIQSNPRGPLSGPLGPILNELAWLAGATGFAVGLERMACDSPIFF